MKKCTSCQTLLPLSSFRHNKYRSLGREDRCKKCLELYSNEFKQKPLITFSNKILDNILKSFDEIKFIRKIPLVGDYIVPNQDISSKSIVYLCISGKTGEILKVGTSTNWKNRISAYSYKDKQHTPVNLYLFEVDIKENCWLECVNTEARIRIWLENNGHKLLWDNTGNRLSILGLI